MEMEESEL